MSSTIFTHGVVHSPTEPYATALSIADGVVSWLGGDDTAQRMAADGDERHDLDGAVLTPLFVDALATGPQDATDRGVGLAVRLEGHPSVAAGEDGPGCTSVRYASAAGSGDGPAAGAAHAGVWLAADELEDAALADALEEHTLQRRQVYLVPGRLEDTESRRRAQRASLSALAAVAGRHTPFTLARVRHRVVLAEALTSEELELLSTTAVSATVLAALGEHAAPGHPGAAPLGLGSLLAAGVPTCLAVPAGASAWEGLRWALTHPVESERVSARSAFHAMTRSGLRALPAVPAADVELAARVAVGERADLAIWRADAVSVQAPDGRVAAWSTDTRAGTPLLPDLSADTDLPVLEAVMVGGVLHTLRS